MLSVYSHFIYIYIYIDEQSLPPLQGSNKPDEYFSFENINRWCTHNFDDRIR